MQHSEAPWRELARAHDELNAMCAAESVDVRQRHWNDFLRALDRLWNKADASFGRSPKWPASTGRYVQARRQDELLAYLTQARNAEEHSDVPASSLRPGGFPVGVGPNDRTFIKSMYIDGHGRLAHYVGNAPLTIHEPQVNVHEVENRGRKYPPPRSHLGQAITPDVLVMAEAGFAYYKAFLEAAEEKFVGNRSH